MRAPEETAIMSTPEEAIHRSVSRRRILRFAGLTSIMGFALLSGCAKYPSSTTATGPRVTLTMTVAGQINPNYVYIFAMQPLNVTNPTTQGPIPVIAQPWGNGFVAGNCKYFVRWDPTTSPRYTIYKFQDTQLTQYFAIGAPVNTVDVPTGGRVLQFEITLNQIADTPDQAAGYQTLQLNYLTMNKVPQGTDSGKAWDALGDSTIPSGINQFVNIPLTSSRLYNNASFNNLEPAGDVADPDLDIVDWSIQVNL